MIQKRHLCQRVKDPPTLFCYCAWYLCAGGARTSCTGIYEDGRDCWCERLPFGVDVLVSYVGIYPHSISTRHRVTLLPFRAIYLSHPHILEAKKNKMPAPSGPSTSKSSASSAKDAAVNPTPHGKQPVPTDKASVQRIVNMMHGGTMASLGLDACCCCCGSSQSQPIELKLCTIGAKRGPYLKGRGIYEWCEDQAFRLPFEVTIENVMELTKYMVKYEFLFKAAKTSKERKAIAPTKDQKTMTTDPDVYRKDFYIWHYEGNPMMRKLLMGLIISTVIFFCLMPAWPRFMKVGVWYCSVTILLGITGFSIVRFFLWLLVWICSGWHLLVFPYIFIDGIPIGDAFTPWGPAIPNWNSGGSWYKDTDVSMRYYRIGALVATIGIGLWVYSQPTEFDDYMAATQSFTDDLYSGNLLSDMSNTDKVSVHYFNELIEENVLSCC